DGPDAGDVSRRAPCAGTRALMKVTVVTTWFPTAVAPTRGSFVVRDTLAIARHQQVRLVHLVPPADDDGTRRLVHEGIEVLRIPTSGVRCRAWTSCTPWLSRRCCRWLCDVPQRPGSTPNTGRR